MLAWSCRVAPLPAQGIAPPATLHRFFCTPQPARATAWAHWLERRPPARTLLKERPPDFSETLLNTVPPIPDDDPFAETLRVYGTGVYQFGLSGGQGFNLRQWPRTWPQLFRLLRLRNLLRLREWIQPESNALRLQNLVGMSFYFYF